MNLINRTICYLMHKPFNYKSYRRGRNRCPICGMRLKGKKEVKNVETK